MIPCQFLQKISVRDLLPSNLPGTAKYWKRFRNSPDLTTIM